MRIDKFLWFIRFYKTRTLATEAVKSNRIEIDEQTVKASREVKINDKILIKKNQINYKIIVKEIPKSRLGAKLVLDYITDFTDIKELEMAKLRNESQKYYRQKGLGRPTKKDRRSIDDFVDEDDDFIDFIIDSESE